LVLLYSLAGYNLVQTRRGFSIRRFREREEFRGWLRQQKTGKYLRNSTLPQSFRHTDWFASLRKRSVKAAPNAVTMGIIRGVHFPSSDKCPLFTISTPSAEVARYDPQAGQVALGENALAAQYTSVCKALIGVK